MAKTIRQSRTADRQARRALRRREARNVRYRPIRPVAERRAA